MMEFLQFLKDAQICNKDFKVDEATRHFSTANATQVMAASGSVERHADPNKQKKGSAGIHTGRGASPGKKRGASPAKERPGKPKVDKDLTLFEFVNCLAHLAFWRLNPQHGSKYNKRELTPVPQCVSMLLNDCVLPNAKRDTSAEFKKVLADVT